MKISYFLYTTQHIKAIITTTALMWQIFTYYYAVFNRLFHFCLSQVPDIEDWKFLTVTITTFLNS